ncbi:MAG: serine/threonine protein kinase [Alphaproteobacteria bacterium]|nr:serine/threonine protein kinase [Alphaproteobacteria bacterium]
MIGSNLDKYEVLSKIGEGGMATVYRGRHATLKRQVAIKVLHPHLSSSTRNRVRFAREARAIEHLRHPHILEIFDYSGVDHDDCYIITELVDGETLTELMHRCRRLPSEVVAAMGLSLAEALAYAHAAGILHRDLKPDNVMLRRDGCVKLMDFGIARFLDETQVTMTGALVGSPAFMSPEQAREEELDVRSDLFSLGTLLYFLVTGHLPFSGSNPSLILKNIIEGNRAPVAELAPTISPSLADVIERLLSPAPDDRHASADEVVAALRACLDEVGFDPEEPRWSLARVLDDADALERELEVFLGLRLLEQGRDLLAAGDHLGGLRLINRLLTMEPDHPEALALLQRFHGVDERDSRRRWFVWAASAVLVVLFGAFTGMGWLTRDTESGHAEPREPAVVEAVAALGAPPAAPPVSVVLPPEVSAVEVPSPATPPPVVSPETPAPAERPRPRAPRAPAVQEAPAVAAATPTDTARTTAPSADGSAEAAPVSTAPACVEIRTPEAPAEIYVNGEMRFHSRQAGCFPLSPGVHEVEIRGVGLIPKLITVDLAPGERRELVEHVDLVPASVHFPSEYAEACEVLLDGTSMGTVGALRRRLVVVDVRAPHVVGVRCGRALHEQPYDSFRQPDVSFPSPGDL